MTDDDDITTKDDDIDDGKRQLRMLRITLYEDNEMDDPYLRC